MAFDENRDNMPNPPRHTDSDICSHGRSKLQNPTTCEKVFESKSREWKQLGLRCWDIPFEQDD